MSLPFFIAKRYLFSKKSHNAINIISMVSVCGVVLATIALVCALSVYNGFSDLFSTLFSNFDPDLKISPRTGKVFVPTDSLFQQVQALPEVEFCSEVLEDNALVRYRDRQQLAVVKGVDEQYASAVSIDSILYDGQFILQDPVASYATLGIGLASALGVNVGFQSPLEIYSPKRNEKVNLTNPSTSFETENAFIGGVFCVSQAQYDEHYMLLPLASVRRLLRYKTEVSALELKIKEGCDIEAVKQQISTIIGKDYAVENRYEQQASSYRMLKIEKWMTFFILAFILSIALFNVVGSLSMLIIEKKTDTQMLRNMGADERLIKQIFLFEGWLIAGMGATVGIIVGLLLCYIQQFFGIIQLGVSGAFIVDAYPVRVDPWDVVAVFLTVMTIGFLAAWYPVVSLMRKTKG